MTDTRKINIQRLFIFCIRTWLKLTCLGYNVEYCEYSRPGREVSKTLRVLLYPQNNLNTHRFIISISKFHLPVIFSINYIEYQSIQSRTFATSPYFKECCVTRCWRTSSTAEPETFIHIIHSLKSSHECWMLRNRRCVDVQPYLDPELLNAMEYAAAISSIASYGLYVHRSCQSQPYGQMKSRMQSERIRMLYTRSYDSHRKISETTVPGKKNSPGRRWRPKGEPDDHV